MDNSREFLGEGTSSNTINAAICLHPNSMQPALYVYSACCELVTCGCDAQRQRWADIIGNVDNIDLRGFYPSCAVIFGYRRDFASRP